MGLFDKLKKPQDPKRHPDAEPLNETLEKALFAEIEVFDGFSDEKVIFERGTVEIKTQILESKINDQETRIRLAAWNELRKIGYEVPISKRKKVLGVVIEVGLYDGIDYLAAYEDHRAIYSHYDGKKVVWESDDKAITTMIDKLIKAGQETTYKIGLWDGERKKGVANDMVRMTFLTPAGIYLSEGTLSDLMQDSKAKPVLDHAMELMKALMAK